jgi:hypothetical protein
MISELNIDLSHWSCKQLCEFHNHVKGTDRPYKNNHSNIMLIRYIKQTLIDKKYTSKYVLNYRGKL